MAQARFVRSLSEVGMGDIAQVGGKNASLGEMIRSLTSEGIRVPNGFCVTADGYRRFLAHADLDRDISRLLSTLSSRSLDQLSQVGHEIRQRILDAELPTDLREEILTAYTTVFEKSKETPDVAVRSSGTAEDLPSASFAGQQETFLHVRGAGPLLESVRRCFASLYTDRAISYRHDQGFDHAKIAISVGIQKMVRSDLAGAGVLFTIDTETGFENAILINATYGLGETVVKGTVNPDEYTVFKPTLMQGLRPILRKRLGTKDTKLVYDLQGTKGTKLIPTELRERHSLVLTDDEILLLARWGVLIEKHYGRPMDIEWAKDGITGDLYIVQARPETVQSAKTRQKLEIHELSQKGELLLKGQSVGDRIGSGPARLVRSVKELPRFQKGEILVAEMTDPDWEPVMKLASAIVTNKGGRTCHAAIVARELRIPAVVGTERATDVLKTGDPLTVSCAEGEAGAIYRGILRYDVREIDLTSIPKTRTQLMMNIGNPELAFGLSFLPNAGVGLAREEFIVSSMVKVHPLALLYPERVTDEAERARIVELTRGYPRGEEFFIEKLAEGVALIAAAFYPKDVILRFSDFKTNEYANLLGGSAFEPKEANPMMGWRGASRYYTDYAAGFALECRAIRIVREQMGLSNIKTMIPMVRTIEEARKVLAELEKNGMRRGENGLEVYMMCEVPSNAILAAEFLDLFDGFSIGSNDLTQFTLAVDRDSELVAFDYDEEDPAVKNLVAQAINAARRKGKKIGICGQAPSDKPAFARFLVEQGIDSISLNPDSVLKTLFRIAEWERGP